MAWARDGAHGDAHLVQNAAMRLRVRLQRAPRAAKYLAAATLAVAALQVLGYLTTIQLPPSSGVPSLIWLAGTQNPRVAASPGVSKFAVREFSRVCCEFGPTVYRDSTYVERSTKYFAGERGLYSYKAALHQFVRGGYRYARVFVPVASMDEFLRDFFLALPGDARIVVVSGQEDCGPTELFGYGRRKCRLRIPVSLPGFILDPRLVRWYAQNYDFINCHKVAAVPDCLDPRLPADALSKLRPLPIGMDYHTDYEKRYTMRQTPAMQETKLKSVANLEWSAKKNVILSVFTVATNRRDRGTLMNTLEEKDACVVHPSGHIAKFELWREHAEIAFVFCPQGNGIDTHRVYESLNLGSVPVVRSSPLDSLYKLFPIVILKGWDDFGSCSQLAEWRSDIVARFGAEPFLDPGVQQRLSLAYWISETARALEPFSSATNRTSELTMETEGGGY